MRTHNRSFTTLFVASLAVSLLASPAWGRRFAPWRLPGQASQCLYNGVPISEALDDLWLAVNSTVVVPGPQGPQGPEGPVGPEGPTGPSGADGLDGADGAVGPSGADGLSCFDLNGNGQCDPASEDANGDGICDARDCQGPQGEKGDQGLIGPEGPIGPSGADGLDGADGAVGPSGADGLSCFDLNGNGQCDILSEDTNGDGECSVADCQGPEGSQGPAGPQGPSATTVSTGSNQAHTNVQPFQVINYIIALNGIFPSRDGGSVAGSTMIGEIRMFAGNFAPSGYALCDGQLLSISSNTALFSILGTTYGGDGRTTFGLPDLRGRVAMHAGNGPGLSSRLLGQKGGVESVALTVGQLPSHNH